MTNLSEASGESVQASEPRAESVDVCIIGGGIAGVVAALRAQERGLSLHLIEARSVLHTCRPDTTESDADPSPGTVGARSALDLARTTAGITPTRAVVDAWKQDLVQRGISFLEGARVFAIEREDDGGFCVRFSEASLGRERRLRSRAVLVATGAPHTETPPHASSDGAARWRDPASIERPTLVVGAGIDAIEAVIENSDAKARAGSAAPVYWCAQLGGVRIATPNPVESAAGLGDRLLLATLRNQNVHVVPHASALTPIPSDRPGDWLSLEGSSPRDPHGSPSTPVETPVFERSCIFRFDTAGARADTPGAPAWDRTRRGWELLSGLSVRVDRRDDESLLVVDPGGRLSHVGLYAAGAVRGESYLSCEAFEDDSQGEVKSGVRYRKVRRADGLGFAAGEAVASVDAIAEALMPQSTPPRTSRGTALEADPSEPRFRLVRLRLDGSAGPRFELTNEVTEIGRAGRDIEEPDDADMADHHASLVVEGGEIYLADSGRGSGVWLRVQSPDGAALEDGDQVWLGAQILMARRNGAGWMLEHYGPDGVARDTIPVDRDGIFVGRESGRVLDPSDGLLSRRHAQFRVEGDRLRVYDRGARNGTYVKVSGAIPIEDGDEFRASARGYRLERVGGSVQPGGSAREAGARAGAASRGGNVELRHGVHPRAFPVVAGATILQGFIEARGREGEPLAWECQTGSCGLCVVEVLSGADQLLPVSADPDERRIIEQTVGPGAARKDARLACLTKVNGDVVLRTIDPSSA